MVQNSMVCAENISNNGSNIRNLYTSHSIYKGDICQLA